MSLSSFKALLDEECGASFSITLCFMPFFTGINFVLSPLMLNRFYLGLALCQQKDGLGKRKDEAIKYLSEGIEHLLIQMTVDSDNPSIDPEKWQQSTLSSSNLMRPDNAQWLQGCVLVGNACKSMPTVSSGVMSTDNALHLSSMLASYVLSCLVARGDTYHQVAWVLFENHFQLLQMMLDKAKDKGAEQKSEISRFCENLSGLLNCSNIPPGKQILELQEKVRITSLRVHRNCMANTRHACTV